MLEYLVFLGAAVQIWGIWAYAKDTFKGTTKPNRVTWFMWSLAPFIATAAALSDGVKWAALPVFMSGFGPFVIFLLSFVNKNSYWKLESFDWACGIFSLFALVLWWVTKDPTVAIAFAIASDASAAIPTIVKSWKSPETETVDAYTTGLVNALTGFAALSAWSFPQYAFPVYLVAMNSFITFVILRKKLFGGLTRKSI